MHTVLLTFSKFKRLYNIHIIKLSFINVLKSKCSKQMVTGTKNTSTIRG